MKTTPILALLALLIVSCTTSRVPVPKPAVLHVAPSTVLVSRPVAAARASSIKAAESVIAATAGNRQASVTAKHIVQFGIAAGAPEAIALERDIDITAADLFRASVALRDTGEQLAAADARIGELDTRLIAQTEEFNATEQKRAEAEARAFHLDIQRKQAITERDKLKRELWWSKFKIWGGFVGALGIIVAAFAFKVVGLGSRVAARVAL
ncbi:MAG: hypothetical protein V4710_18995 [Verrucomicrobiota bacterium]